MKYQFMAEYRQGVSDDDHVPGAGGVGERILRLVQTGTQPAKALEDALLAEQVKRAFENNRCVYGSPRVHAELRAQGLHCARKRVARLMREQGLFARRPRHRRMTTHSEQGAQVAPNLLQRDFHADEPNSKWVADTTYIWTTEGWLFLAVVLDLFSRMVVGWSMAALQDATLVVNALEMALARRRPQAGLLHHSDRGSTSTSESYLALLQHNAMTVSMSRTANCYDHAVTEAFASLASKVNVLIRSPFSPVLRLVIAPLSIVTLFIIELVDIPPYST